MGLPGSGKDKQAALLSEKTGFPIISTGDKLREIVKEGNAVGRKVAGVINLGELMPSWFVQHIFQQGLFEIKEDDGIIFDGACRMEPEARLFAEVCGWLGRDFRVFHFKVSEATVVERLRRRQKIEDRRDDDPTIFQNRLKNFYEHTVPAIEYFRSIDKVIDINGEPLPEDVFAEVWQKASVL